MSACSFHGTVILTTCVLVAQAEGARVTWSQTVDDVRLHVPVDASVRGRDVQFEVHPKRLSISISGKPVVWGSLDGAGVPNVDGASSGSVVVAGLPARQCSTLSPSCIATPQDCGCLCLVWSCSRITQLPLQASK